MSKRSRAGSKTGLTPEAKEPRDDYDEIVYDEIGEELGLLGTAAETRATTESYEEIVADLEELIGKEQREMAPKKDKAAAGAKLAAANAGSNRDAAGAMDTSDPGTCFSRGTIVTQTGVTVAAVGKPPRKAKADRNVNSDQEEEKDKKRARSSIEIRVFLWEEGLTKSMEGPEWDVVIREFAELMFDPRYESVQREVNQRERTIMNTSGNKNYGVIGVKTKEGAVAVMELLHGIEFEDMQIQAKIHLDLRQEEVPTKVEMYVSSKGILGLADKIAENLCRLNGLPGKVLGQNVNGHKLEIYPDAELLKALEKKKDMTLSVGILTCKYKLIRNKK